MIRDTMSKTLAMVMAAGLAGTLVAQEPKPAQKPDQKQDQKQPPADKAPDTPKPDAVKSRPATTGAADYCTADSMRSADVVGSAGDHLGDVSGLVIDRSSGTVAFVVVKTGSEAAIAGKPVALPFGSLRWNEASKNFTLNTSEGQIKSMPEFSAQRWPAMLEAYEKDGKLKKEAQDKPIAPPDARGNPDDPAARPEKQPAPADATGQGNWRYLLAESIDDMKVQCRDEKTGKVHKVIVDRKSGRVAFLSIDPNENALGVADTKRLVPWPAFSLSNDRTVRIDADKQTLLAAPMTPSNVEDLERGDEAMQAYRAFKVTPPTGSPIPTPITPPGGR